MGSDTPYIVLWLICMGAAVAAAVFILIKVTKVLSVTKRAFVEGYGPVNIWKHHEAVAYLQNELATKLRAEGHSEQYISNALEEQRLKWQLTEHKLAVFAAWIAAIACLFIFPPLGLFLTFFALFVSIREGMRSHKAIAEITAEIEQLRRNAPEI